MNHNKIGDISNERRDVIGEPTASSQWANDLLGFAGGMLGCGSIAGFAIGAFAIYSAVTKFNDDIVQIVLVTVLIVAVPVLLFAAWRRYYRGTRLVVGEEGAAWIRNRKLLSSIVYAEVDETWIVSRGAVGSVHVGDFVGTNVLLKDAKGKKFIAGPTLENLSVEVLKVVSRHLWSRYVSMLRNGDDIDVGELTVTSTGLKAFDRHLQWDQISSAGLEPRDNWPCGVCLCVMEWENDEPWLELRHDQIPNPQVAAALLGGLVAPVNWMREFREGDSKPTEEDLPALFPAIHEMWEQHSDEIVAKGGTPTVDQHFGQLVTYSIP